MAVTFPTTLDSFSDKVDNVDDVQAVDINDVQDAIEALETKVGINSSAVTASLDYKVNNFLVTGRQLYLYENTAPTGWSIIAVTDKVLAVKGGSDAYNANGGTTAGDFVHTHADTLAAPAHTHSTPSHQHPLDGTQNGVTADTSNFVTCDGAGAGNKQIYGGTTTGADFSLKAQTTSSGSGTSGAASATALTGSVGNPSSAFRPTACLGIMVLKA